MNLWDFLWLVVADGHPLDHGEGEEPGETTTQRPGTAPRSLLTSGVGSTSRRTSAACRNRISRHDRPVVVIDPEDAEQVGNLVHLFAFQTHEGAGLGVIPRLQAALREFAAPTPTQPAEPQGLGAVVEDAEGGRWVRTDSTPDRPWWAYPGFTRGWDRIGKAQVLSEGVK